MAIPKCQGKRRKKLYLLESTATGNFKSNYIHHNMTDEVIDCFFKYLVLM